MLLDLFATVASAAFSGACLSMNLVEVPLMVEDLPGPAVPIHFGGFYPRARSMQIKFMAGAVLSSLLRIVLLQTQRTLLLAHIFNVLAYCSIFAYTVRFMLPTNFELLGMVKRPQDYPEHRARELVQSWGKLNLFRVVISAAASLSLLYAGFSTSYA